MSNLKSKNAFKEEQKEEILILFYRTELRENEKIIDNSDVTIAKELGHSKTKVSHFISSHLNTKRDLLNKRVGAFLQMN